MILIDFHKRMATVCAHEIFQTGLKIPAHDLKNNQTATNPKKEDNHVFCNPGGFASKYDISIRISLTGAESVTTFTSTIFFVSCDI